MLTSVLRTDCTLSLLFFSHGQLSATAWNAVCWAPLSFTIFRSLLRLLSIKSGTLANRLTLCCPLLLLPSIFPSIRVFSGELALCIR